MPYSSPVGVFAWVYPLGSTDTPKRRKGTQHSAHPIDGTPNRKPRETQRLSGLRAPEGMKLGFTKFLDVYTDKLDLRVLAHRHLLS
ncbi:hypothetical protein F4Z99_03605 [Candidatus Poribacteria bacterium]|nr:hypothetical protein [Candidatus Poribacteria bacterium]